MKPITILFLDGTPLDILYAVRKADGLKEKLATVGLEAEIDAPRWCADPYHPDEDSLARLATTVRAKPYDLIVVGNNLDAGLQVVQAIPVDLRSRVIVLSNTGRIRCAAGYIAVGTTHFAQRHFGEVAMIQKVLGTTEAT